MHSRTAVSTTIIACVAGLTIACSDDDPVLGAPGTTSGNSMGGSGAEGGNGMGGSGNAGNNGGNGGDGGMIVVPGEYPAGPYGNQENDIFPYLEWEGRVATAPHDDLTTGETWTDTYTSLDLFQSGAGFAMVHTALSG